MLRIRYNLQNKIENTITDKVEYIDTCITLLEGVMRSLNSRSFDIKNAIEWTKFTNGLL